MRNNATVRKGVFPILLSYSANTKELDAVTELFYMGVYLIHSANLFVYIAIAFSLYCMILA